MADPTASSGRRSRIATLTRAAARLSDLAAALSAGILAAMVLLILAEILLWNLFEKTTLVADEYSAYGLAAIVFLGSGHCLRCGGHIRLTLVLGLLPQRWAAWLELLAVSLSLLLMAVLWRHLFHMVQATHRYHSTSGTLTNTPLWIPQAVMVAGAAVLLIQLAAAWLEQADRVRRAGRKA